ncbi:MAG: phage holin family protein [Candidatus Liptonbacteria bacterium]|nr:phage holin family protein [Candidatus Liptonbacteria bacterium]
MKLLAKLLVAVAVNAAALFAAAYIVPSFTLNVTLQSIVFLAVILTLLNLLLKPLLKLILGPLIVLTLGFGLILVNMVILYILDIISPDLTIGGIVPLVYSSLIIGVVNFVFHFATKE